MISPRNVSGAFTSQKAKITPPILAAVLPVCLIFALLIALFALAYAKGWWLVAPRGSQFMVMDHGGRHPGRLGSLYFSLPGWVALRHPVLRSEPKVVWYRLSKVTLIPIDHTRYLLPVPMFPPPLPVQQRFELQPLPRRRVPSILTSAQMSALMHLTPPGPPHLSSSTRQCSTASNIVLITVESPLGGMEFLEALHVKVLRPNSRP
ncbi:hypothetical protein FRC12_008792 [Ceratobasidium sp. 428]|nr:hypothetical protein FRC12_008792 [Ceratobasidium sp. 428]